MNDFNFLLEGGEYFESFTHACLYPAGCRRA